MNRPSLLVIVRHAESKRSAAKKDRVYFADDEARAMVRGVPDPENPLTALGVRQAEATGAFLRRRFGRFDYVYHSGYRRTIQTADGILKAYTKSEQQKVQVRHHLFIRERDPGYAYDMTQAEAERAFPWMKAYWKTFGEFFARPAGGESLAQVAERVYLFLNMLFRDRAGKKILVVTHDGNIRCFRFLLERWDYAQALSWPAGQAPKNCGATVYTYHRKKRRLVLSGYNLVAPRMRVTEH